MSKYGAFSGSNLSVFALHVENCSVNWEKHRENTVKDAKDDFHQIMPVYVYKNIFFFHLTIVVR